MSVILGRFTEKAESLEEFIGLVSEIGYDEAEMIFKETKKFTLPDEEESIQVYYNCRLIVCAGSFLNRFTFEMSVHEYVGAQVRINIDSVRKEAAGKIQQIESPIKNKIEKKIGKVDVAYEQNIDKFFE